MKAEDEVLKVYPKAISTLHGIFSDRVIIVIPPFNTEMDGFWGKHLSDHFYTARRGKTHIAVSSPSSGCWGRRSERIRNHARRIEENKNEQQSGSSTGRASGRSRIYWLEAEDENLQCRRVGILEVFS